MEHQSLVFLMFFRLADQIGRAMYVKAASVYRPFVDSLTSITHFIYIWYVLIIKFKKGPVNRGHLIPAGEYGL